jgi:hypothetical protein
VCVCVCVCARVPVICSHAAERPRNKAASAPYSGSAALSGVSVPTRPLMKMREEYRRLSSPARVVDIWEESRRVRNQPNTCNFSANISAMAECLDAITTFAIDVYVYAHLNICVYTHNVSLFLARTFSLALALSLSRSLALSLSLSHSLALPLSPSLSPLSAIIEAHRSIG